MENLGITYNYETGKATMRYAPSDAPKFAADTLVEVEFDITDENVLEAHDFMSSNAVKVCSNIAGNMEVDPEDKTSASD